MENGNSVYELPFYNYTAFYYYYFTIISLLFFPYFLDHDLDASNMKDKDRVDLQIEAESIPTDLPTERHVKDVCMKQVV